MERICTKCGNPIDDGDSYCDICGEKYEDSQAVSADDKANDVKNPEKAAPKNSQSDAFSVSAFAAKYKDKLIFAAIVLAVMITAVITVSIATANTPEAALRKAVGYRISGNVNGSAAIGYECNFSKTETRDQALTRMKGNTDLTTKRTAPVKLKIKSETRLLDDKSSGSTAFTDRKNSLSESYNDAEKITDIRDLTYELIEGETAKMSGTAQAVKVNGKWYIIGVAETALTY